MKSKLSRAMASVFLGGMAMSLPAFADWPQFQGPNRDGISTETGLLKIWPAPGPRELWSLPVGKGYASPAVAGGEVYFLDRENDERDILRCLSLADGKEQWRLVFEAPGTVGHTGSRNPPTVDEKYVYTVGLMGHFLCADRKTHAPVWQKDLQAEFKAALPNWGFSQSPVLYKNLVIVAVQAPDAHVIAFDRDTGNVAWKSPGLGLPGYVSPLITTLAGVEQVVTIAATNKGGTTPGGTAGLSLADGSVLWMYDGWQCPIPIPHPTPLSDDKLFISGGYGSGSAIIQIKKSGDGLVAEEVSKIDEKVCGVQIQQPILYKGFLYLGNNSNERELGMTCMAPDGTVKWSTGDTEGLPKFERGPFIVADGMFIILDGKAGTLHLAEMSPEGYKELAQAKVLEGKELWGPLTLVDGKLIVRSQEIMKCLDLKNP